MAKVKIYQKFNEDLITNQDHLLAYIQILVNPSSVDQFKQNSQFLLAQVCKVLKSNIDKPTIIRIAKFTLYLIMTGHFHILHLFDNYLLPTITSYTENSANDSKFIYPISDKNQEIDPLIWKYQFAYQLLHILAQWFPYDLLQQSNDHFKKLSVYAKIVEKSKIKLKGFYIYTLKFITAAEKEVQYLSKQRKSCQYCISLYEDLTKDSIQNMCRNIKQTQINAQKHTKQNQQPNLQKQKQHIPKPTIPQSAIKKQYLKIHEKIRLNKNKKLQSKSNLPQKVKQTERIQQIKTQKQQQVVSSKQKEKGNQKQIILSNQEQVTKSDYQTSKTIYQNNDKFTAKIMQKLTRKKVKLVK